MINKGFKPKRNIDHNKKLPPGQYIVDDLPILTAGPTPKIDKEIWNLEIMKNNELILSINWNDLMKFPQSNFVTDIHCVTKWSIFDTSWEGVYIDHIIENTELKSFNGFILAECYGGYTTNLPTNDLIDKKSMIAHTYNSNPLDSAHGGPARLIVPHLYFWKSPKWIKSINFIDTDKPGFWEGYGYHMYGDPWKEQRYYND